MSELGVNDIILDPGFGLWTNHWKVIIHFWTNLEKTRIDNFPILAGISRKSMITKVLNIKPEDALTGTTVLNTIALLSGANILRVHDVEEAKEVVKIVGFMGNEC